MRTRIRKLGVALVRQFSTGKSAPKLKRDEYDVVVVGGGLVGSAFACSLASHPVGRGLRVAVLEAAPPKPPTLPEAPGIRVSALSLANVRLLKDVGAWDLMVQQRVTPYTEMQVWHTAGRGRVHWKASDLNASELGFIVENDITQGSLYRRLQALATESGCNFEALAPVKVQDISRGSDGVPIVTLEGGQKVAAQLLVGADGQMSQVKRFGGFDAVGFEYNQRGLVASVRTSEPSHTAWQRYLPNGPLALLPCHGNYSNIVWSTTPEHAAHLASIPEEQFLKDVNSALRSPPEMFQPGGRPAKTVLPPAFHQLLPVLFPDPPQPLPPTVEAVCTPRLSFPLRLIHVTQYTKANIALIGDAAHAIHPMAGQGLNLGLGDAKELADTIVEALQLGLRTGDPTPLKQYERKRQAANLQMMAGVHAIKTLFTPNEGPLALARSMGLDVFNAVPALKNSSAAYAMGIEASQAGDHRPSDAGATPWHETSPSASASVASSASSASTTASAPTGQQQPQA